MMGPRTAASRGGGGNNRPMSATAQISRTPSVTKSTIGYGVVTQKAARPAYSKPLGIEPMRPSPINGPLSHPWVEFNLRKVRPPKKYPFTPGRRALVRKLFQKLDIHGSGVLEIADMRRFYNAKMHPMVIAEKLSPQVLLDQVMAKFQLYSDERDGKISRDEFEDYYQGVSSDIEDDGHFAALLASSWRV